MRETLRRVLVMLAAAGAVLCRAETHSAVGCRVELSEPINPRYPGSNGAATLVDGVTGSLDYGKDYLGIEGPDLEVTVRLPMATVIHALAADFVQNTPPAIFLPVSVDFAVSENGRNFRTVATVRPAADEKQEGPLVERLKVEGLELTATAVRIRAGSGGKVPPWHRAPQAERWIFLSEVLVNPGEKPVSAADLLRTYRVGASRWPLARIEEALRQGTPEERRRQCLELVALLGATDVTLDARRFCLDQVALFGAAEDVGPVAAALAVPELATAAAKALAHLGGPAAETALMGAVAQAPEPTRGAAIAALAAMHSPRATELAERLAPGPLAAVTASAIAAAGTPAAAQALAKALAQAAPDGRPLLTDALLRCADALLAQGDKDAATGAYAAVEAATPAPLTRLPAVAGQVRAGKTERLAEVLAATAAPEVPVARSALSLGAALVAQFGPGPIQAGFGTLPTVAQAAAVRAVGTRARADEVPWVLAQLAAPATDVRTACAEALGAMGGAAAVGPLAGLLAAEAPAERAAALEALTRLSGEGVDAAILAAATGAAAPARRAFCTVLQGRQAVAGVDLLLAWAADPDPELRRAAWKALADLVGPADAQRVLSVFATLPAGSAGEAEKALPGLARAKPDAVVAALRAAPSDAHRATLLGALGAAGGPVAGAALAESLQQASPDVRGAAARALAGWADSSPAAPLLAAAAADKDERLAVLCLRSALAVLAAHGSELAPDRAGVLLEQAAGLARRDEDRQALVAAAGATPCPTALDLVLKAREAPALAAAAEPALLALAPALWPEAPGAVRAALQQVAAAGTSPEARKAADERLAGLPPAEVLQRLEAAAWTPLFDGQSLTGWRIVGGKPDAWAARDGLLVAQAGGGGWLATTTEYADYLIEFEFRLAPGGNSGLFLRPPLEGNPAFEGIEIQLLDDAATQYAGIRPDQYCASIYGMAAATPRVSLPAGEWQRLRALCAGRRVAVWLNGIPVAQADLDAHMAQAERIPGLKRASGFPGLQNEHGPIEFRSLRLKNLAP